MENSHVFKYLKVGTVVAAVLQGTLGVCLLGSFIFVQSQMELSPFQVLVIGGKYANFIYTLLKCYVRNRMNNEKHCLLQF